MNAPSKIEADSLNAALARAQAALSAPSRNREVTVKTKTGGSYKFKYATLDHLIEHIRKPLTDNGLWFIQRAENGAMVTRIIHASGEDFESSVPMPNLPTSPQEAGSVLTYFRRYSLSVALGLASDEDDDANVAEGNGYEPRERNAGPSARPLTDEQWARIVALCQSTGTKGDTVKAHIGATNLKLLTEAQFDAAVSYLNDKLADAAKAETDAKAKELT